MSVFENVADLDEIPAGQGMSFALNGRVIGLFHIEGEYYAIDDHCPHMGASLSAGHLEGCVASCPLHAWRFDVRDGTWCDNPRVATDSFDVEVREDGIYVATEPRPPKTSRD